MILLIVSVRVIALILLFCSHPSVSPSSSFSVWSLSSVFTFLAFLSLEASVKSLHDLHSRRLHRHLILEWVHGRSLLYRYTLYGLWRSTQRPHLVSLGLILPASQFEIFPESVRMLHLSSHGNRSQPLFL